ncbi:hypothetical protein ACFZBP_40865 [Streptomyces sp. NPDC008086]|uniref:hypothetical protein n=1 Tax=Streptomyces sp. NPDC008086 TaxID=3364807 RepID=UPI0036E4DC4B
MKTDASGGRNLRKAGTGGPRLTGFAAARQRGAGSRIGSGVLGVLALLFGLILVGVGYEEGPRKVSGGTQGTITVERCGKDVIGDDVECSGTFRSDDGKVRSDVEDFEPGEDAVRGEEFQVVGDDTGYFRRGSITSFYVDAVKVWFVAVTMFGVALFPLSATFRRSGRPMRRGTFITGLGLLFGGLLGCGVCALVNAVLG